MIDVGIECFMTVYEVEDRKPRFEFPDDDGAMKRPWVKDPEERGRTAELRVREVIAERDWIVEEAVITEKNGADDEAGVDVYARIDRDLLSVLGIEEGDLGIAFQVKSSEKMVRRFVSKHKKKGEIFGEGRHTFVLNGQDAKMLILTDIIGQMVVLARMNGVDEETLLIYLDEEMEDNEAVDCYLANRMVVVEDRWYGNLLEMEEEE